MDNRTDNRNSTKLAIMSWAPLVMFVGWIIYYMAILGNFIADKRLEEHFAMAGQTAENYTSLFITLALASIVTFAVMLYLIWHVWTKTNLPAGQKVMWVVFLVFFAAFAFPVYWYMHLKNERPRNNASPALS